MLAVTGAAGALGGYLVQLAKVEGLRVIADASPADEATIRTLGADEVVRRGDGVALRMRDVVPDRVDALFDSALQGAALLAAVRDGGQFAAGRTYSGPTERDIVVHDVLVMRYAGSRWATRRLKTPCSARRRSPSSFCCCSA